MSTYVQEDYATSQKAGVRLAKHGQSDSTAGGKIVFGELGVLRLRDVQDVRRCQLRFLLFFGFAEVSLCGRDRPARLWLGPEYVARVNVQPPADLPERF